MTDTYLGLDCSTQSLTAALIKADNGEARPIHEESLNFDSLFPEFGTRNGVLPGAPGVAHTPPQLWVKALDALLGNLASKGLPLNEVACIGTSGQQHGSVYLNETAESALQGLSPESTLADQLSGIYSRATSPIWMDSSTSQECAEITEALGGDDAVCRLTGSRTFERFTGPQIRKFFKEEPQGYARTRHICLVSSFIPSLLSGRIVPIDPSDGAGMNLMDIAARQWSPEALRATAPNLAQRLHPIVPSDGWETPISPYCVRRYGFSPDCRVIPGAGDNPSSLVGLGLVESGCIGISLGTSDTLFAFLSQVRTDPAGQSHVFGSPTGHYMAISVYKNGSLAREAVRNGFGLSWEDFSRILAETPPGNRGRLMLPYFDTEIIPRISRPGVRRIGFDENDTQANVRGVVEAQMLSMRLHSEWMRERPGRIYATGGASANRAILQVMADAFGVPVARQQTSNAAALGAAVRARHHALKSGGREAGWQEIIRPFLSIETAVEPDPQAHRALSELMEAYRRAEAGYPGQGPGV